jgi:predicted nucleic acid-binding protein
MTRRGLTPWRVFVDTSAFFALSFMRDSSHRDALLIRDWLIAEHAVLFTTNFILAETHALALSRINRDSALRILQEIDRSSVTVIRADTNDEQQARAILLRYTDKDFSLTDAISFSVISRLQIDSAFSFDTDFAQYGVSVLQPP